MMKLIPEKDNLIVTKTFSKIYAMAGMRLGFAAACPELLAALGRGGSVPGACRPEDNEKFILIVEAFMKEKAEKKVS